MDPMPASNSHSVPTTEVMRYALVTGGGSGLGRAFCRRLASDGWHVCVTDIDLDSAKHTLADVVAAGGMGQAEHLDVTDIFGWQNLLAELHQDWPRLDLLINNAGVCAAGEIGESPVESFQDVLDINFHGVLNGCQTAVPWLKKEVGGGHIVNVASIFGLVAPPTMGAYNVSKAAVVALSETLYGELLPHGIGVTVVAPGFFASQLVERGDFATAEQRQIAEEYVQEAKVSAEEVVDYTLDAIQRRQLYVVLGRKSRWIWRLKRWLPTTFARLLAWRYRRKLVSTTVAD